MAALRTDEYLIREDPSLKTFWNFVTGQRLFKSRWTAQLHQEERLHIIYLAVRQGMQHHGLAAKLLGEADPLRAESHRLMISLETHNPGTCPAIAWFGPRPFRHHRKTFRI